MHILGITIKLNIMSSARAQSGTRADQRGVGLVPNSTKISKHTTNGSKLGVRGYRKGRFQPIEQPKYDYQRRKKSQHV